jgi:predicted metal-binding membrane protein
VMARRDVAKQTITMAVIQEEVTAPIAATARPPLVRASAALLGISFAVLGWGSMVLMWTTGTADVFGHAQEGVPSILAMGLFLIGWMAMVAAMMLPSSLPTLGRVDRALLARGGIEAAWFMAGYFMIWAVFGAAAFAGDGILHLSVDKMPWLAERPWLITAGVAMFAGIAEILGRPPPPGLPSVALGVGPLALGRAHAEDRVRRCWPLMLFAMAVGMSSPVWMAGLTILMALELRPRASTALRYVGLFLFGLGAAVIIEPGWALVFGPGAA